MTTPELKLFISYRKTDNPDFVMRIREALMHRYSRDNVFIDFDNVPPFVKFQDVIKERVETCDTMIVIIGPEWLDSFTSREHSGDTDWVRFELGLGLARKDLVIAPICIKGAEMPNRKALPDELRAICDINASYLESGRTFYDEFERIVKGIENLVARNRGEVPRSPDKKKIEAASRKKPISDSNPKCSFCERGHSEVDRLIAGPNGVFICSSCVELCTRILYNKMDGAEEKPSPKA